MNSAILTAAVVVAVVAFASGPALAADPKSQPPSAVQPGVTSQTPAVLAKKPDLQPLISTAGPEPKFGVMNMGQADAVGEFWISVTCVPVNPAQGNCKLNMSNDPQVNPNDTKFKVSGGVPMGGVPKAKWFGLGDIPGAAGPNGWQSGGWKFKVTVDSQKQIGESNESNNTSPQWHTWIK